MFSLPKLHLGLLCGKPLSYTRMELRREQTNSKSPAMQLQWDPACFAALRYLPACERWESESPCPFLPTLKGTAQAKPHADLWLWQPMHSQLMISWSFSPTFGVTQGGEIHAEAPASTLWSQFVVAGGLKNAACSSLLMMENHHIPGQVLLWFATLSESI